MDSDIKFRKYPRAKWHKYDDGIYFITIVTQSRKHYFGYVMNGEMILSLEGKIADKCLKEISSHYPSAEIHNFVVMPNHVHILLQIVGSRHDAAPSNNEYDMMEITKINSGRVVSRPYGAIHAPEHPIDDFPFDERCHSHSQLSAVIGGYKSAVTKQIRKYDADFRWQARFHDHIVRDQRAYDNINQYITDNPIRWNQDCFNGTK